MSSSLKIKKEDLNKVLDNFRKGGRVLREDPQELLIERGSSIWALDINASSLEEVEIEIWRPMLEM